MSDSIVVARPAGHPAQLVLLFHGVGASAADMLPLGQWLAGAWPQAQVVCVAAPYASDLGRGRQWFSVQGVTEDNRLERVAQALPEFVACVQHWQRDSGVGPAQTILIGFSQGSIMSLEATQLAETLAGRVVAIAGRFAQPPRQAPGAAVLHLLHGEQDGVIPARHSVEAAERLRQLGASVTLDLFPGLGHGVDGRVLERLVERLRERPEEVAD